MKDLVNESGSHQAAFHKSDLGGYTDQYNLKQSLKGGRRRRRKGRRSRRRQRGGERYETDFSSPMKGRPLIKAGTSCGTDNAANMGVGNWPAQTGGGDKYSYATTGSEGGGPPSYGFKGVADTNAFRGSYAPVQVQQRNQCGGGRGTCKNVSKINSYAQVSAFWSKMCPHACKLYRTHVKGKEATHNKEVVRFLRHCTRALCQLLKGLKSKTAKGRRAKLSACKKHLAKCQKTLRAMGLKRASTKGVKRMCEQMLGKSKTRRGRRHGKRRTLRGGGYSQFGSNVANTPLYSTGGAVSQSAMATPPAYTSADNCNDNYNHYRR